jgi:2-oxoglutarate dehydrogenase E2 component (dihydrolipoamide succinyltransferase)
MPVQIVVPDLGESVIEATVARWLKNEGDPVASGEAVVVLETDKVDLEVAAGRDGVLGRIEQPAGSDVKVGDVLGLVDESDKGAAPRPAAPPEPAPVATPQPAAAPSESAAASVPADDRVTPVARRMAEEQHVDLSRVQPKNAGSRITKEDVERYLASQARPAAPARPAAAPPPATDSSRREERVRMSRRRRTIAQRLVEVQHTAAMLTTFNEVDMTAVMDLRTRRKEAFQKRNGVGLGLSSFFVKATIGALKAFPNLNAEIDDDEIIVKHYYDIGVAIGATEGLVVPVLRDADRMSFAQIEQAIKNYAKQSEDGTLSLEALRGGTFTITNGGVFGSLMSTPILNPPQVGILGLHKIQPRPVAIDNEVVIRPMMYVALSYDHRIVDGREAVQFLVRIKELVEDPESLLIEG